ncbi:MAG: DUF3302 domain-containing protein [Pirellulaceae bacterium]
MDVLSYVALAMLLFMIALLGVFIWFLGGMPGRVAVARNHPSTQAITMGGWASLLLGVVTWPLILMWAYSNPASTELTLRARTKTSCAKKLPACPKPSNRSPGKSTIQEKPTHDSLDCPGVVLLSGNAHFAEISAIELETCSLFEFTSSGLTHINESYAEAANKYRVAGPLARLALWPCLHRMGRRCLTLRNLASDHR